MFTKELSRRHPDITTVAVHPGFAESGVPWPASFKHFAMYGQEGALMPLSAATTPGLRSGSYVAPLLVVRGPPSPFNAWYPRQARNPDLAAKLWAASVAETGVDF